MPHVSLILCVKDGMPYLPDALASVSAQTYRDFELVVQDGASTDGSLDVLEALDVPAVDLVSEADGGIGDAYNRAVRRCTGAIVGTIDSDNVLEPDALERAVAFLEDATFAAAYGGSNMIDAAGTVLYPWMPDEPNLLRLLACELVPPFAVAFFDREVCGDELRFDPALKTCADFDLWLRLWHMPIARMPYILGGTRLTTASMTRRTETYDQYIADKRAALDRYLGQFEPSPLLDAVRAHAEAGIHLWSAESVYDIEGRRTPQFERYVERAVALEPGSPRAAAAAALPPARDLPRVEEEPPPPTTEPTPRPSPRMRLAALLRR
jgi:glycosyltransferase involved in cell wall biosynthesis